MKINSAQHHFEARYSTLTNRLTVRVDGGRKEFFKMTFAHLQEWATATANNGHRVTISIWNGNHNLVQTFN